MARCFSKLTQTSVRIEVGGGRSFDCPMLPVSAIDEFDGIREMLGSVDKPETLREVFRRLREMAARVLPEEYAPGLARFTLDKLIELVAYLIYGDDDDQPAGGQAPADAEDDLYEAKKK